ncbi:substrate-binding domain-containing protein [Cryptosporangium aurantiacum]|uniref:Ribose transport system substrate-binding protein n=1 Tax=Cryptosporangium aurantiacum TaxID=134849 RepID=A0A1M7RIZ6_9ACTN|nr:substrate-binding domain-containing protein [Cryptosporangium aurantiacum]SHN46101.1 ribose transport system substrate-binding protein [Cryptosporangium aurantiacum]
MRVVTHRVQPFRRRPGRTAAAVVACALVALTTSGCLASEDSEAATGAAEGTRLGLVLPDSTTDTWDALRGAAVDQGPSSGIEVSADASDDGLDAAAQISKVEAFAPEQLGCFAIAPVDSKALVEPLAAFAKKGVPIFNVGLRLDETAAKNAEVPIASFIGPSDIEIGHQAARKMLTSVPRDSAVVMVVGSDSDPNAAQQRVGFKEAVEGTLTASMSRSTGGDYSTAVRVVTDTINAVPNLRGIFAPSDTLGRAAAKAIASLGKTGTIKVISVGGTEQGLRSVQSGELTATVATYPSSVGEVVVRACREVADGKSVKPRLTTQSWLVDKANVAAEIAAYPESTQPFSDPLV